MQRILCALLVCVGLSAAQDNKPKRVDEPTKEQVKEALDAIAAAKKAKKDSTLHLATIRTYGGYNNDKVVRAYKSGLWSKNLDVKLATIEALGWNRNKEALRQLHRLYHREKKTLFKDEILYSATFKAIGRHGDRSSIRVLGDRVFKGLTDDVAQARIFSVGNIRHKDSVVALLKGMRLTGGNPVDSRVYAEPRGMMYFGPALAVLTGEDFGQTSEAWQKWWRKNKNKFKMSKERPPVRDEIKAMWEAYWEEPY